VDGDLVLYIYHHKRQLLNRSSLSIHGKNDVRQPPCRVRRRRT
jgi:hypothetical protein